MVDFSQLLSKRTDDVSKPKPLPVGQFHGTIKQYELGESQQKKTPYVRFFYALSAAGEGIEPEDMEGVDLSKRTVRNEFYLTEDSMFRLKDFLVSLGMDIAGRSFNELLPETVGMPVLLDITQRPSQDGEDIYADVKRVVGDNS